MVFKMIIKTCESCKDFETKLSQEPCLGCFGSRGYPRWQSNKMSEFTLPDFGIEGVISIKEWCDNLKDVVSPNEEEKKDMSKNKCKHCERTMCKKLEEKCFAKDRNECIYFESKKSKKTNMEKIAKMLGVEICEEFDILSGVHTLSFGPWHFDKDGLYDGSGESRNLIIGHILSGVYTIQKLPPKPWKPKNGEPYHYLDPNGKSWPTTFFKVSSYDYAMYNAGNCFKTSEEITPEIIKRILAEMKGPYDNE